MLYPCNFGMSRWEISKNLHYYEFGQTLKIHHKEVFAKFEKQKQVQQEQQSKAACQPTHLEGSQ